MTAKGLHEPADTVDIDLELGKFYFPNFEVPDDKTATDYLRELCIKGLKDRYQGNRTRLPDGDDGDLSQEVHDRLERELGVIDKLGFPTYFLIVWDFIHYAKEKGISEYKARKELEKLVNEGEATKMLKRISTPHIRGGSAFGGITHRKVTVYFIKN